MNRIFGNILVCSLLVLWVGSCKGGKRMEAAKNAALENRLLEGVLKGMPEVVDSCLKKGADANIYDDERTPLLILAANSGNQKITKRLIKAGAKVDARRENSYYSTALMEVSTTNNIEMASLLLKNGADVTIRDTFGDPAINWASYYGHTDLVKLLLDHGADPNVKSKHGTALEVAIKQWQDELVAFYIAHGIGEAIGNPMVRSMVDAVKAGRVEEIKQLLGTGGDPDVKDEVGSPLIVLAASKGYSEILGLLLDYNADPDQLNAVGQSALSRAAYFGHYSAVMMLLDYGAEVDLAGKVYNLTPLLSASNSGEASIGKLLLERGANVDAQDGLNGFTPLMFATGMGHVEFVDILLQARANPYIKSYDGGGVYDMLSLSQNEKILKMLEKYIQQN